MTREELYRWAERHGFAKDRYGYYVKGEGEGAVRLVIRAALRWETRHNICGKNEWIRIRSAYVKSLSLNDKDQLCGLKR